MVDMEGEAPLTQDPLSKNSDDAVPSSSSMAILGQKPGKRPTRQWAAWTREEEESFFNALRQVGKNFEKITCRVQSKNKDQVRHYYYRLVRRMNKLLGPGVYLDAKNSKDTIAAMLRWWSLLEKFSCTASKLHLKPRRFKIFVEALESQLLKDRNKTRRKRYSGDMYLPTNSPISKGTGDTRPVKLAAADSPNTNKVLSTKEDISKHEVISNINFSRKDSSGAKALKHKERSGLLASAAYKKWEKAAIAGVSLVADAAEQLEQAGNRGNYLLSHNACGAMAGLAICSHETSEPIVEPTGKLKLQLFPIDESTRRALEKEAHNPFLELTLSARKRISSVLEHLNRKWGNSQIASAELMLFPYNIQHNNLASCQGWSITDTIVSTADVHAIVGSPALFRLRYGWFTSANVGSEGAPEALRAHPFNNIMPYKDPHKDYIVIDDPDVENHDPPISKQPLEHPHMEANSEITPSTTFTDSPESKMEEDFLASDDGFREYLGDVPSWVDHNSVDGSTRKGEVDVGTKCGVLSSGEWADSLTNISIGDLFSEASKAAKSSCLNTPVQQSDLCLWQNPFSCDSFDAAVAAHVSGQQLASLTTQVPHASIFTAEETCDEFSFRISRTQKQGGISTSATTSHGSSKQPTFASVERPENCLKEFSGQGPIGDPLCDDLKADVDSDKDAAFTEGSDLEKDNCLTDVYWPDSLGPLDLDIPPSKFGGQDLIFGENLSLSGFSRLISNNLVTSQGCSLFGVHGKDSASGEACGSWG